MQGQKSLEVCIKEKYMLTGHKVIYPILCYSLPSYFRMKFLQRKINRRILPPFTLH